MDELERKPFRDAHHPKRDDVVVEPPKFIEDSRRPVDKIAAEKNTWRGTLLSDR